jgi:hypothetical protein
MWSPGHPNGLPGMALLSPIAVLQKQVSRWSSCTYAGRRSIVTTHKTKSSSPLEVALTSTCATRDTDELTQSQIAVHGAARDVSRTLAVRTLGDPYSSWVLRCPRTKPPRTKPLS